MLMVALSRQKHEAYPHQVLAQRIRKHLSELFLFVEHPEVPPNNNLAERSPRPAVAAPKAFGRTRPNNGLARKMGLSSPPTGHLDHLESQAPTSLP